MKEDLIQTFVVQDEFQFANDADEVVLGHRWPAVLENEDPYHRKVPEIPYDEEVRGLSRFKVPEGRVNEPLWMQEYDRQRQGKRIDSAPRKGN